MSAPNVPDVATVIPILLSFGATYGTELLKWLSEKIIPNMELPFSLRWIKPVVQAFIGAIIASGSGTIIGVDSPEMLALYGAGIAVAQASGYRVAREKEPHA